MRHCCPRWQSRVDVLQCWSVLGLALGLSSVLVLVLVLHPSSSRLSALAALAGASLNADFGSVVLWADIGVGARVGSVVLVTTTCPHRSRRERWRPHT